MNSTILRMDCSAMQNLLGLPGIQKVPGGMVTNFSLGEKSFNIYDSAEIRDFALVGDSIFLHQGFYEDFAIRCVPPLPVWDELCFSILEDVCSRASKVVWSCGNEMVGCNFHGEIVNFPTISPVERRIKYNNNSQRSWMHNELYKYIPKLSIQTIRQLFLEQINYFLDKYPNLILAPLMAYRIESLELMKEYCNVWPSLKTTRCLDLDRASLQEEDWADSIGHLSNSGVQKIIEQISA